MFSHNISTGNLPFLSTLTRQCNCLFHSAVPTLQDYKLCVWKDRKGATTASSQVPPRHVPTTKCSEQIKCHYRDSIESPSDYEAVPTVHPHEAHNFPCDERIEVPCEVQRKVGNREIGTDFLTTCHVPRRPADKQSPQ